MYGHGNYPQLGQGSQRSVPQFQQRPVLPPHPPFQQGPPSSQPSIVQQGHSPIPPHVRHSAPPMYQHAPPAPLQQGTTIRVSTSGMLNAGQSYMPPPTSQQVHGSSSVAHSYPTVHQNSQWTHNMHNIPPPVPPLLGPPPTGPNNPEMFRLSLPGRVLPTLPSQGQTLYKVPMYLPRPGIMQQQMPLLPPPPLPPPPTSSVFTPSPSGSFVHSAYQDPNVPASGTVPPPPPPSSPPALPPSPPPPTSPIPSFGDLSSTSILTESVLSHNFQSGQKANHSSFEVISSGSVDKALVSTKIRDDVPAIDDCKIPEGMISCEVSLPMKEDLSLVKDTKLDLHLPPPKPSEEKVMQKIEVLCHFIAKNVPSIEDIARQKENENPEFKFLFGGESGIEAAIVHEYSERMEKKCFLEHKLQHGHSNSVFWSSDIETSEQTIFLTNSGPSHSPDSDTDMEDDITQPNEEQRLYDSFEDLNHETVLIHKEVDNQEHLHAPGDAVEYSLEKDVVFESSGLAVQDKGSKLFRDHDDLSHEKSVPKVDSPVTKSAGAAEGPSNSNLEKSYVPPLEDLSQSNTSAAAARIGSGKFLGELIKGASPFRLLQDYASDGSLEDDDKPCLEDVSLVKASPSKAAGATSLHGVIASDSKTDAGSNSLSSSDMRLGMFAESIVAFYERTPLNGVKFSPESQKTARETDIASIATYTTIETCENKHGNLQYVDYAASLEALQQRGALDSVHGSASGSGKSQSQKKDVKYLTALPKVDEFGRLVREGASDSDSDESRYTGRRDKRRRSWSRSRSPRDRRRRRRRRRRSPPCRRMEKRSRSRSWSPKKRSSRSRSPAYRRGRESGGDKMKNDQGQLPECFDFLRGRCHRGASCRYMHHGSNKSDGARRGRKQQYVDIPHVSRTSDFYEEIEETPSKRSAHEQGTPGTSFGALKNGNVDGEKISVSVQDAMQSVISAQDDESLVVELAKSERSGEVTTYVQETEDIKEEKLESVTDLPNNENCLKLGTIYPVSGCDVDAPTPGDASLGIASSVKNFVILHSQTNLSLPVLHSADHQPQHAVGSSTYDSLQVLTSTTFPNQLPVSEPQLNKIFSVQSYPGTSPVSQSFSSQSLPLMEFTPPTIPAVDIPNHLPQLPPLLPSLSQGKGTLPGPQLPGEYNPMQSTAKFSSLSPSNENLHPYQGPLQNQPSHFAVPPNSSWSLPPPPPLPPRPPFVNYSTVNAAPAMQGVPSIQFPQNELASGNDFTSRMLVRPYPPELPVQSQTFVRHYPPELPAHSQMGEFQYHSYPLMHKQVPRQPSLRMEDFRPKTLPMTNPMSYSFGGASLVGEDHFSQVPVRGLNPPDSYPSSNITSEPVPSLMDSTIRRMQSFPGDNIPSGGFFTSSSQDHPYSQQQRSEYGLRQPAADSLTVNLADCGNINSNISSFTSYLLDRNHPSYLSDFGGSKIPNYYNPYASTFDQPLSSKFSSNVVKKEKDILYSNLHDASYSDNLVDEHGVGSVGSRLLTSSPKRSRAPRSGSDQYDPLFDSIEPFSNSFKKFDHGTKHEPTSDSLIKLSGSHKPLDAEEEKQEDGVVTITTSSKSENDEFGETADAEVGHGETESASNPLDAVDTAAREVEIDQVKMLGKSMKSKDSRSMKLLKVALADFVKGELKPYWQQSKLSKEAFKTIVKKTIDKVSGAIKGHQIPKSQAKINRYIDSSYRKLHKLVMGYIKKYS